MDQNAAPVPAPPAPQRRPIQTKRGVSTEAIMARSDLYERLEGLNQLRDSLHFSHNEARRILGLMADTVTQILLGQRTVEGSDGAPAKPATKRKNA